VQVAHSAAIPEPAAAVFHSFRGLHGPWIEREMLRSVRSRMQDYPVLVRKPLWLLVALVFAATTTAMEVRAQELIARRVLKLGVPSGSPAQEFHRIADVDLIGDSIVAVASTGTHDVRLFDSRGRFLRSWGRQGGGPGEFQFIFSPGGMYVVRDSIWILDSALQRVTVFSTAGEYGRAISLSQFGVGRVFLSGIFADGSFLLRGSQSRMPASRGWHDTTVDVVRADGSGSAPLGTFYWTTQYMARQPGDVEAWGSLAPPGTVHAVVVSSPDAFWYADGRQPVVEKRRLTDGMVVATVSVRSDAPDLDLDAIHTAQRDWLEQQHPAWQARIRRTVEEMEPPPQLPRGAYDMLIDDEEAVWYTGYTIEADSVRLWYRHDADGTVSTVRLPYGFRLHSVAGGILAGAEQDALGVEYVVLYRLSSAR
jgi:hypothetical protein